MEINRRSERAKTVAAMWRQQYYDADAHTWGTTMSGSARTTYNKLVAAKHDPDKLDEILGPGFNSWTAEMCCECKEYKDPTVSFGSDEWSATVCMDCIKKAKKSAL